MYNTQEIAYLDLKSNKYLFLGYVDGVKGYRMSDPAAHKLIISRNVIFIEDKRQVANDSIENESSWTTTVNIEK